MVTYAHHNVPAHHCRCVPSIQYCHLPHSLIAIPHRPHPHTQPCDSAPHRQGRPKSGQIRSGMKIKRSYLYVVAAATVCLLLLIIYTTHSTTTTTSVTDTITAPLSNTAGKLGNIKNPLTPYKKDKTKYYKTVQNSAEAVHKYIDNNTVMVFSKSYCPHSKRAKEILKSLIKGRYVVLELDKALSPATMAEYQAELQSVTGARTVPRVFVDGKSIGGADDVARLQSTGELQQMLQDVKILST